MLTKRIIPCLDIKDGRTVKGVNFENITDAGDAVELAARYCEEGADELVFLDISATNEGRKTMRGLITEIAKTINIPFTTGGGISSVDDVENLLAAGADKVSVNTAAFNNKTLISDLAKRFGSQCIVVAIDINYTENDWYVYLNGGRKATDTKATDYAIRAVEEGAGEILLTSMSSDGTKKGFACDITNRISKSVRVPVIASGGAGNMLHFKEVLSFGNADAALAASVFHYKEIEIKDLKQYLRINSIDVRL
jgi:imidazole glycerol-phosphate synthase subunit HisF